MTSPNCKIIEIDNMTGNERELPNYDNPTTGLWTREAAEKSIAWREQNITSRYRYELVEV